MVNLYLWIEYQGISKQTSLVYTGTHLSDKLYRLWWAFDGVNAMVYTHSMVILIPLSLRLWIISCLDSGSSLNIVCFCLFITFLQWRFRFSENSLYIHYICWWLKVPHNHWLTDTYTVINKLHYLYIYGDKQITLLILLGYVVFYPILDIVNHFHIVGFNSGMNHIPDMDKWIKLLRAQHYAQTQRRLLSFHCMQASHHLIFTLQSYQRPSYK